MKGNFIGGYFFFGRGGGGDSSRIFYSYADLTIIGKGFKICH